MTFRPGRWHDDPACHGCGAPRPADAWAKGWRGPYCNPCDHRWLYHGRPEGGPPPPRHASPGSRAGRLEDYAELRAQGKTLLEAAKRVGVSKRTAEKYQAALRRTGRQA